MPTGNEQRYKDSLTGKTVFYKGDFRDIYNVKELAGCCKPFYIVLHFKHDDKEMMVLIEQTKESELFNGLGNSDFKLENIASVITQVMPNK